MKGTNEELQRQLMEIRSEWRGYLTRRQELSGRATNIERELDRREAVVLKQDTGVEVYRSFDCAGMSVGRYKFYFGYEKTACCNHGKADCSECIEDYWCFTAEVDGVEVMRIPAPRLGQDEVLMNLLHGIGQFVAKEL